MMSAARMPTEHSSCLAFILAIFAEHPALLSVRAFAERLYSPPWCFAKCRLYFRRPSTRKQARVLKRPSPEGEGFK
jgi:hypothetical protein